MSVGDVAQFIKSWTLSCGGCCSWYWMAMSRPRDRFFRKLLHFSDAMQYLPCFMVEFNAVDLGFASLECFFDTLWHFWSCKDSGIWCLWLVIFACIPFAVLAFDFCHKHLAGNAEVPVVRIVFTYAVQIGFANVFFRCHS